MKYRRLPSSCTSCRDEVRQAMARSPHPATDVAPPPDLHPVSVNIAVAGYGRLRRPPSQPASLHMGRGSGYATVTVAEPGNEMVWAGSATAGALSDSTWTAWLVGPAIVILT